jgi:hypothetical protein
VLSGVVGERAGMHGVWALGAGEYRAAFRGCGVLGLRGWWGRVECASVAGVWKCAGGTESGRGVKV